MGLFNILKPNRQNVRKYFQKQLESVVPKNTSLNSFELKDAETYSRISEKVNSEKIAEELKKINRKISKCKKVIEKEIEKAANEGKYSRKFNVDDIDDKYKEYKISHLENMEYFKKLTDLGFVIDFYFESNDSLDRWRSLIIRIKW